MIVALCDTVNPDAPLFSNPLDCTSDQLSTHKSLLGTPHNQQTLLIAMPPTFVQHISINSEWAEALVGLRLNVPNSW